MTSPEEYCNSGYEGPRKFPFLSCDGAPVCLVAGVQTPEYIVDYTRHDTPTDFVTVEVLHSKEECQVRKGRRLTMYVAVRDCRSFLGSYSIAGYLTEL